jgi:O-antigen ligase
MRASRTRVVLAIAVLAIVAACTLRLPLPKGSPGRDRPIDRVLASVTALREGDWQTLTSSRNELWRVAWEIFKCYPLTGSGPGTFGMLAYPRSTIFPGYQIDQPYFAAHSMPLNLLAELGVIGMVAWTACWLILPLLALLCWKAHNRLALAILCIGLGNIVDTVWLVPGTTLFSVLAIILACGEHERTRNCALVQ